MKENAPLVLQQTECVPLEFLYSMEIFIAMVLEGGSKGILRYRGRALLEEIGFFTEEALARSLAPSIV